MTIIMKGLAVIALALAAMVTIPVADAAPYTIYTDSVYVAVLQQAGLPAVYLSDSGTAVVALGHKVAAALQANPSVATLDAIVEVVIASGVDPISVGKIVAAAVVVYTPQYADTIGEAWAQGFTFKYDPVALY